MADFHIAWIKRLLLCSTLAPLALHSASPGACFPGAGPASVCATNTNISLEFDRKTQTRVIARLNGKTIVLGPFALSETVELDGKPIAQFQVIKHATSPVSDARGSGTRLTLTADSAAGIEKQETVDAFPNFPSLLFVNVRYINRGRAPLVVTRWTNQAHSLHSGEVKNDVTFWSLESGSYERRPNWVVPVKPGFAQQNYLGMNAGDYGGGTPVIDVWRPDVGLAVGHDELTPELVSEPVTMPTPELATVAVQYEHRQTLAPGQSLKTYEAFVAVHTGDYFRALRDYRRLMMAKGVRLENAPADAFQPIWCAWGFGRKFRPEQIEKAIPEAQKLGFGWVTMDDGWQTAEGDWQPNPSKFPHGDADVRALVDKIHAHGMKAQLWWSPLSVSPSSKLMHDHPDWLLLDDSGKMRKISWFNTYYLCPADPAVVRYHQQLTERILKTWGFDGLKIDGQFLNAVPPCTNPAHHHASPLDSVHALPLFFKAVADAAHVVDHDALLELCPCGTSFSFFSMPYYNMTVASDPESSWQVRSKAKTLKALVGDELAYFGDHVELSDNHNDFASTVGVGGVIGTEYRWPPDDKAAPPSDIPTSKLVLTPDKEQVWAKWVRIYRENMLSKGQYLGDLYDIGFDKPETHCVKKGTSLYYAFYAPNYDGTVTLRGLSPLTRYRITDYVNNRELGSVEGPNGTLKAAFSHSLLIVARPFEGAR